MWCKHKAISWPRGQKENMYVVCMSCLKQITYNWNEMRVEKRPSFWRRLMFWRTVNG